MCLCNDKGKLCTSFQYKEKEEHTLGKALQNQCTVDLSPRRNIIQVTGVYMGLSRA
jgi:hypothetical protein